MYQLNDKQIDFILDDIKRNGVEMEDLQSNLLDHICCIVEQELEENGDFEHYYSSAIKKFYKKDFREIEEETISLLTFKNYYIMKKIMLISGIVSVTFMCLGILFKFLHLPGAGIMIVLGIGLISLLFLPLLFVLKIKERKETKDKVLIGIGTFSAILMCMGVLFKIMFWPFANMMAVSAIVILLLVFLPVYFFTGFRNPETKVNTVVSSLLIITGCGLFLTLVRSPAGSRLVGIQNTRDYINNERILDNEEKLLMMAKQKDAIMDAENETSKQLLNLCEDIKSKIIFFDVGVNTLGEDFESKDLWLGDGRIDKFMNEDQNMHSKIVKLRDLTGKYNSEIAAKFKDKMIPLRSNLNDSYQLRSTEALNGIIQIQMCLLQNQRAAR